jgi:ABC-type sugar transport system permease subunit
MAVRTQTLSQPRRVQARVNVRAWLAFLFGVVAACAIPVAIELTRKIPGVVLLDAVWAIPVAAAAATVSLLFARGARGAIARTLEPVGGSAWIRLARIFAVAGVCITLSASIAVGLYELLLRLEH